MVCPQCNSSFDDSQQCPKCGVGLLYSAAHRYIEPGRNYSHQAQRWQQSPGGRLILGLGIALGLCYGLLQMGMAFLRAFGIDATTGALDPLVGLILFQSLQAVGILTGGVLAGVGQPRGTVLGGLVGILSGIFMLAGIFSGAVVTLVQSYSAELLTPGTPIHKLIMYALPLQHALVGTMGGFIGGFIWQPDSALALPLSGSAPRPQTRRRAAEREAFPRWVGPIAWARVVIGTLVAVVGAINTPRIVDFVLAASENQLQIVTDLENRVAYGEVFGLMILLGGFIAGTTRSNGLKQGTCVGVVVSFVMTGTFLKAGQPVSPTLLLPVLSSLLLAPVGGWFGSELLPPAARRQRWKSKTWF
jgi:hypothetical protein